MPEQFSITKFCLQVTNYYKICQMKTFGFFAEYYFS